MSENEMKAVREFPCLRVVIDLPDFKIEPGETAEDVEVAMNLASQEVGVIFIAHDGDGPRARPRTLMGTIAEIEVVGG